MRLFKLSKVGGAEYEDICETRRARHHGLQRVCGLRNTPSIPRLAPASWTGIPGGAKKNFFPDQRDN